MTFPVTTTDKTGVMETRTNLVDFATYRFARDLRLTEARDAAARDARLGHRAADNQTQMTESELAHRERMLQHLIQSTGRQAPGTMR